jgi:hypothetical protein
MLIVGAPPPPPYRREQILTPRNQQMDLTQYKLQEIDLEGHYDRENMEESQHRRSVAATEKV